MIFKGLGSIAVFIKTLKLYHFSRVGIGITSPPLNPRMKFHTLCISDGYIPFKHEKISTQFGNQASAVCKA